MWTYSPKLPDIVDLKCNFFNNKQLKPLRTLNTLDWLDYSQIIPGFSLLHIVFLYTTLCFFPRRHYIAEEK